MHPEVSSARSGQAPDIKANVLSHECKGQAWLIANHQLKYRNRRWRPANNFLNGPSREYAYIEVLVQ
jgi:hypothetical protein